MANYKISSDAEDDLYRIWLWGIAKYGKLKADEYHQNFIEHFEILAENPRLYPAVDHIRNGYRRSICGVDNVYYRINNTEIEIMSIIGKQDISDLYN